MGGLKKMLGSVIAAAMTAGFCFANDDTMEMKRALESMQADMAAMKADFDAQRASWRSNAGGAPDGLLGAKGKATIRIGGDFRTQYGIGLSNGYNTARPNDRSTAAGWAISKALISFDVDLSTDTSAHIELRPEGKGTIEEGGKILDRAYWQWKNVGGAGFGLTVGLANVPFGMSNNTDIGGYDWGGIDRGIITEPLYAGGGHGFAGEIRGNLAGGNSSLFNPYEAHGIPYAPGSIGVFTSYNWDDQIVLKAGLFASGIAGYHNSTLKGNLGVTNHNELRNIGFTDHVIAVGYNPCYLEGLHLEASYLGKFDEGKNYLNAGRESYATQNGPYADVHADNGYQSAFAVGAAYSVNEALKVAGEAVMTWNPNFFDGYSYGLALTADYSVTEKLMVSAGAEYLHSSFTHGGKDRALDVISGADKYLNLYRLSVGAKYDFGNGIYVRGQYFHDYISATGFNDGESKHGDAILLETGYTF